MKHAMCRANSRLWPLFLLLRLLTRMLLRLLSLLTAFYHNYCILQPEVSVDGLSSRNNLTAETRRTQGVARFVSRWQGVIIGRGPSGVGFQASTI